MMLNTVCTLMRINVPRSDVAASWTSSMCVRWSVGLAMISPWPGVASVQPKSDNSALASELRQLQKKASQQDSFKVKFEQVVFSALRKKTTKSQGELLFSQPRKFRWEISSPSKEVYVNNQEWFWKYVENTKHAVRLPANSGDLEFLDVVFALDKLQNKYEFQKLKEIRDHEGKTSSPCPKNHTCLGLEPMQKGGHKHIELAIDQANGFVSIVRVEFRNGNRTLINFSDFNGTKVSADSFEFNPPPGTAVDKR